MKTRHLNVRHKSLDSKKTLTYINHDLRIKSTTHIKNINDNFIYIQGTDKRFNYSYSKTNKSKVKEIRNHIIKKVEKIKEKHKKGYKEKYKRNIREDRTNSINRGVLTFPRDMENDFKNEKFNKQEFIELGIKTIKNICKKKNIELIYITVHLDETTPHFHYQTSNYDNDFNILKKDKKRGQELQDLGREYFKDFGIERGISKEKTNRRNIQEENEKLRSQIKNQNKIIELQESQLKEIQEDTKKQLEELKKYKEQFQKLEIETEEKKKIYKEFINPKIREFQKIIKERKTFSKKIKNLSDKEIIEKKNQLLKNVDNILNQENIIDKLNLKVKEITEDTKSENSSDTSYKLE